MTGIWIVRTTWLAGQAILFAALVAIIAGYPPRPAAAEQAMREATPVKVANRTVIVLRGPIAGFSGSERAEASMARIESTLEAQPEADVTLEDIEAGKATQVLLGGRLAFTVTPVDIDVSAGETTQIVAREAGKRLERAVAEWREQRKPRYLATALAMSMAATLLYALVLWLLFRGNRWIGGRLSAAAAARSQKLHLAGVQLLNATNVLLFTRRLVALVVWIVALLLASGWLSFVLIRFPFTRPWGEQLEGNMLELLKGVLFSVAEAVPGLVLVVVIFVVARFFMRGIAVFFDRVAGGRVRIRWLDSDTLPPTRRIFNFLVWGFALAMAYPYLPGANTDAFKGLSVLLGVMVSLGGASVIGQAFNGLILMYTHSYRRGEYIRVGDCEGTVTDLGMFTTRIRTGLGEEVTIPNSSVMGTSIKNYSRAVPGTGYVVDTVVTIGYSTPWRQVEAMLKEAAARTVDIARIPPPAVRQTALSDFYPEYRLFAYTPAESPVQRADVLNRLHASIQDVFNEYGVQIMSPHYMSDPAEPQVVPKGQWYAAPAQLGEDSAGAAGAGVQRGNE